MMSIIHYSKPFISDLEVRYVQDAVSKGQDEHCYEYVSRFEELFRLHPGMPYSIAISSCTGALHMGLSALDICPGDKMNLGDTNWTTTSPPIAHLGATPVSVDIMPDT